MAKVENEFDLEKWLEGRSQEFAVAIAVLAALRVLPLISTELPPDNREKSLESFNILTASAFRCLAAARIVAKYPKRTHDMVTTYAASAAHFATEAATATSAISAVNAAAAAFSAAARSGEAARSAALRAVSAASRAAVPGPSSIVANWKEISEEVEWVEQGINVAQLVDAPLWQSTSGTPALGDWSWARMKNALAGKDNWQVWIDWYEDRLAGRSHGEAHELIFASVPETEWRTGPAAANAWIAARLAELNAPKESSQSPIVEPETEPGPTFAIGERGLERSREPLADGGYDPKDQVSLHDRLRNLAPRLLAAAKKAENEHPELAIVVAEYVDQIDRPFNEIDVTAIWALGAGLLAQNAAFSSPRDPRMMTAPLEPGFAGLLAQAAQIHGGFILGFPKGDELTQRADRARFSGEIIAELSEASIELLDQLSTAWKFVEARTRKFYAAIKEGLFVRRWETARSGHAAYTSVRNTIIALGRISMHANSALATVVGSITLSHVDPNYVVTQEIIRFMLENAQSIMSFAEPFPELKIWLESVYELIDSDKKHRRLN
jgi:hypothetical protein